MYNSCFLKCKNFMVWCFGHKIQDVPKLVHASNIKSAHFMILNSCLQGSYNGGLWESHVLKSMIFKIQYMKKKWIVSNSEFHPQNTTTWNSSFWQTASWPDFLIREYFWRKSNLRPVLGLHRSLKEPQKSQNKPVTPRFLM